MNDAALKDLQMQAQAQFLLITATLHMFRAILISHPDHLHTARQEAMNVIDMALMNRHADDQAIELARSTIEIALTNPITPAP